MPKRTDIHKILIIGSGPIVIGQACEFDYSGPRPARRSGKKASKSFLSTPTRHHHDRPEHGRQNLYRADHPRNRRKNHRTRKARRPASHHGRADGLNTAMELLKTACSSEYRVELIGAKHEAISKAEDRRNLKATMSSIGKIPPKAPLLNMEEGQRIIQELGLPLILRPSFHFRRGRAAAPPTPKPNFSQSSSMPCIFRRSMSSGRRKPHRLERIRTRSRPRSQRQRDNRLFDRKLRSHGRSYR